MTTIPNLNNSSVNNVNNNNSLSNKEEAAQAAEDEAAYLEAIEVGAIPNVSGKSDPATPTSYGIQTIPIKFNTYSNINGVSTLNIIVDRNKGTLAWNGKEVKVNEYLIKVSKVRDEKDRQVDNFDILSALKGTEIPLEQS